MVSKSRRRMWVAFVAHNKFWVLFVDRVIFTPQTFAIV